MLLLKMLHRKWIITTLLVLLGTALCVRLGIWQLDRLEGRRAFNTRVQAMRALPALNLDHDGSHSIQDMEWRAVQLRGSYDFENQIAVRNQYYGGQYGYHLLTPLLFNGAAVLVDRGWIPADGNSSADNWHKYDEVGEVNLSGQIRLGQGKPAIGGVADAMPENGVRLELWNNADVARIADQLPYPILPVYIQLDADAQDTEPPIPFQPEIELTEGPHFGYAMQWFIFASILSIGYPFFVRKQESRQA